MVVSRHTAGRAGTSSMRGGCMACHSQECASGSITDDTRTLKPVRLRKDSPERYEADRRILLAPAKTGGNAAR